MLKIVLPVLVLSLGLVGCGSSDTAAGAGSTATAAAAPAEGQRKCEACSTNVAAADGEEKGGKFYCKSCADMH